MEKSQEVSLNREKRHRHIRKKVIGTAERPRLVVYRSLKHIYAQVVDDISQKSLIGVSTLTPQVREKIKTMKGKCEQSREVGKFLATTAKAEGIQRVVFDRAGYFYHGRVKALAEGAREEGLEF